MIDEMILEPTYRVLSNILLAIPGIIYAAIIIIFGWIIASIIKKIAKKILIKIIKIDTHLKKHGLDDALGDARLSNVLSVLIYWWVFLVFIGEAALQLNLGMISNLLIRFISWTPDLMYAILLVIGGVYLADFLTDKLKKSENIWVDRIGFILEPVIIFFVVLISLDQIGIDVSLIMDLVRIMILSLSLGIALAIGLSFGLGLKDETPKIWKKMKKEWNKKRK
ncbi:hypothetical protein GF327_03055 [Candidatus Woesearchaeota archaeon]|nr:hypothetical protein [Candidatus Woesearchaeota archaeon]